MRRRQIDCLRQRDEFGRKAATLRIETGGTVSGIKGDDDLLKTGDLICGNEFVHAELVKILNPLGK